MEDTKRIIIAFVVSFAILMGWYAFFPQAAPKPPQEPAAATAPQAAASVQPGMAQTAVQPLAQSLAASPAQVTTEERTILANDLVSITLSNRGARIEQVLLPKINDKSGPDGKPLVLLAPEKEEAGLTKLAEGTLKPTAFYSLLAKSDSSVTYQHKTADGLLVEKTYTLAPGRYDALLKVRLVNEGREPVKDRLTLFQTGDFSVPVSSYIFRGPAYVLEDGYHEVSASDSAKGEAFTGSFSWAGVAENYFLTAMAPKTPEPGDLSLRPDGEDKNIIRISLTGPAFDLAPGTELSKEFSLYIGPKDKSTLAAVGANLEKALYFGWFTVIAKPLMVVLNAVYGFVGNYGLAIIILTFLIKLLFWPLSAKSFKSMARMKELQPKVDRLKEKYGDDKEKLNMEMMQLWKTHKVNPFSGCLPMLVQIPVFIALYNLLMHSIEIRHAPFVWWLKDLSAPDPYYITPLLMGASMFLQQKLTPATGMAEAQQKIMLYGMPILFTWMFKDFASGLVVYWLMNNVFSILQQALMMREPKAPAKAG